MASGQNKYRLKVIILLSFLGMIRSHSMAQTDAFMSQYYEIPTLYNPAAASVAETCVSVERADCSGPERRIIREILR